MSDKHDKSLCTNCRKFPPMDGVKKCEGCREKYIERRKRWMSKRTPEQIEEMRKKGREAYRRRVAEGKPVHNPETRARRSERLKAEGKCVVCGRGDVDIPTGTATCLICRDRMKKWATTDTGRARRREWNKRWSEENKERTRELGRKYTREVKRRVIDMYGGFCACCGEVGLEFLTIDHINNDGNIDRRAANVGRGGSRHYWKMVNEPRRMDLQVLCWNCNLGKARNDGTCPHVTALNDLIENSTEVTS